MTDNTKFNVCGCKPVQIYLKMQETNLFHCPQQWHIFSHLYKLLFMFRASASVRPRGIPVYFGQVPHILWPTCGKIPHRRLNFFRVRMLPGVTPAVTSGRVDLSFAQNKAK